MLKYLAAALVAIAAVVGSAPALASEILTRELPSATLGRTWSYAIYLPTNYGASGLRYPVLYLLHGNAGKYLDWTDKGHIQRTADALMASGDIPSAIIVMPDAGTTWYVDRKEPMETAVLRDLIPDVQKRYRAIDTRDGRLVAGLSMGGFGAMRFALKYPEMFAAAALLSPSIYDPEPPQTSSARRVGVFGTPQFDTSVWKSLNYPALWEAYLARKTPVPMFINSGDDDDFFIEADAAKFYGLLRRNQQPAELRIVNGAHDWEFWASTIGDAMRYIFRYASRPIAADPVIQQTPQATSH